MFPYICNSQIKARRVPTSLFIHLFLQVSEEDTEQRQASAADASDPSAVEAPAAAAPRLSPSEKQFLAQLVTGQMPAQQAKNWFRKSAPAISSQFPPGSGDVDLSGIQGWLTSRWGFHVTYIHILHYT